jgi:tetratricopeptide (TPR) repeat protein
MRKRLQILLLIILAVDKSAMSLHGQGQGGQGGMDMPELGAISVTVHNGSGEAVNSIVSINLYKQTNELYTSQTVNSNIVRFQAVPLGHYIAEAEAPGFESVRESVDLERRGQQVSVSLTLQPTADPNAKPVAPGPPLVAPKVQKELHAGLEAMRTGKLDEARKQLMAASHQAPNNPDVNYLLGVLSQQAGDAAAAKGYWQKALSQFPNHLFSLLALGDSALNQGDLTASKGYLDRALTADPSSGRAHFLHARVDLQDAAFEQAAQQAQQAIELDKEEANAARMILAKAQAAQHQRDEAIITLNALLKASPSDTQAETAHHILQALNKAAAEEASHSPETVAALTLPDPAKSSAASLVPPPAKWMPPDVDEKTPPVKLGVSCPLARVLAGAGKRVVEFTKAVDHFSATEFLEHQVIDRQGVAISSEDRKFNYLVSIQEVRPGYLNVDEYRDGSMGYEMFPDGLATVGLPSIILMFHPVNVGDYDMTCEGLGSWQGAPAWQVHFRHRDETRSPIRTYKIGGHVYPVSLKGRAWIGASNFQVLRIETDLSSPMPEIKLLAEHQALDYGPVRFKDRSVQLWLPADTDIYFDYRGKRVHRRHSFSDFLLFSVDDKQKIEKPREAAQPPVTAPTEEKPHN